MLYVLGGDSRIGFMAEKLQREGYAVYGLGTSSENIPVKPLSAGVREAETVILGLPATRDGETVFAPFYNGLLELDAILKNITPGTPILCGMPGEALREKCKTRDVPLVDYLEREELALLNAVPTAEGALEIAMRELPITIWGARCLVVGFGRIGQYLARALSALGAKVTVSARRASSFALCKMHGYKTIETSNIAESAAEYDVIFNTVPHTVLDAEVLARLPRQCLIIDLASRPGGVDFAAAKALGVNTIWALSLPGKVAPVTAGEILCDTICRIRSERN